MSYHVHKLKADMSYDLTVTARRQLSGQTTFLALLTSTFANDIPTQSSPMWVNSDFITPSLPPFDWWITAPQTTVESTSEITEAVNSSPTEPSLVDNSTDSLSDSFENSSQAINMTYNEGTLVVELCVR